MFVGNNRHLVTQRDNPPAADCTDDTCLIDQFTICLVFCKNLSTRGEFKTPPARNPATSIPRAIMSLFMILLIPFSKYFSVQLFQPRCLLCSQQLEYNINTSLMLRHVRANHETLLPRLNQAGRATLNYFWGNLPWGCDLQFLFILFFFFFLNSSETILLCAVGTRTGQEISLSCLSPRWKLYDLGCLSLKPTFVEALGEGSAEEPRLACRGQRQWI